MSVPAAVIQTGPGGSGGVASIPGGWRTVVIVGGALAALVAVVLQRSRGTGGASEGSNDVDGLSTSANIALGQVAYEQRAASGEASKRDAALSDALTAGFAGLASQDAASMLAIGSQFDDVHAALGAFQAGTARAFEVLDTQATARQAASDDRLSQQGYATTGWILDALSSFQAGQAQATESLHEGAQLRHEALAAWLFGPSLGDVRKDGETMPGAGGAAPPYVLYRAVPDEAGAA
jgi:hypothetical protein